MAWKAIHDFEGVYEVSDAGEVRSWKSRNGRGAATKPHMLNPVLGVDGRLRVTLCSVGYKRLHPVHRLVLEAFVGPCPPGMEACHEDGNPRNNVLRNLRWDTRKNNHADKWKHGTEQTGERNGNSKLTTVQVNAIRNAVGSQRSIAKKFKVCPRTVFLIKKRLTWRTL